MTCWRFLLKLFEEDVGNGPKRVLGTIVDSGKYDIFVGLVGIAMGKTTLTGVYLLDLTALSKKCGDLVFDLIAGFFGFRRFSWVGSTQGWVS